MSIGRNDPCPCGSGKKYKKCCLQDGPSQPEEGASLLRHAQGSIEVEMVAFLAQWVGDDALAKAKHEFDLDGEYAGLADDEGDLFSPWVLYEWRPKAVRTKASDEITYVSRKVKSDDRTVSEAFVDAHDDLPVPACEFLECVTQEPCSFYDVVDVVPGRRLLLRDILRETERMVVERSASQTLRRGDILFGRVVPFVGVSLLIGSGSVAIPPDWKGLILKMRASLREEVGTIETDHLLVLSQEIRRMYFRARETLLNPPTPKLSNTDGDPLELHTLTYVIPSADAAFEALKSLATGVSTDDLLSDAVRDGEGHLTQVEFPWLKLGNTMNKGWNNTVLGQIRIEGTRMTVEVNSVNRATRVRAEIRKRLGDQIGEPTVTVKSAEELERSVARRQADGRPARIESESARLYASPEIREVHREMMEKHWDGWVQEKIPALGGITPIEAVKDADGREMVEALLTDSERHQEQQPAFMPRYDIDRVRIRLGLPARGKVVSIERLDR